MSMIWLRSAEACEAPYFLYGGTLLGYARIEDILPWDDDFDVAMEKRHFACISNQTAELVSELRISGSLLRDVSLLCVRHSHACTSCRRLLRVNKFYWLKMSIVPNVLSCGKLMKTAKN